MRPGGTIVEATSGNTGVGLALVAAVRGYKMVFTVPDKQSREKIDMLKAFGAEVIVCPTAVEPEDPRSYYSVAKKLAREIPSAYFPNQYENPANPHEPAIAPPARKSGKTPRGKSRISCAGWAPAAHGFGSGKISEGTGDPKLKVIGVDPQGSLFYEYWKTGNVGKARTYVVEGIGEDIIPAVLDFSVLDDVIQVNDEECFCGRTGGWRSAKAILTGRLGRRMHFRGAARGAGVQEGRSGGGHAAGFRRALFEQDLQATAGCASWAMRMRR